ncbi:MAG: glycosyltransferase [Candidatus Levybacteria bacterium]|nr:glycosyltransferase [Candidatus Levybacteria bacterium]
MGKIFLSIVIPCYDEMANLQKGVLDKVEYFLNKKKFAYEIIVVDDGSKDGSVEFIKKFAKNNSKFRLIENSHLGKAGAVTTGVLEAKGDYILFTDMDQATPIEEMEKILPYFEEKNGAFDVVIGSRNTRRKGSPFYRLIISRSAIILRKIIVGVNDLSDTQCGFKAFKRNAAQKLFTRVKDIHSGFKEISGSAVTAGFDIELLYLASKMGYKIKEVPVEWLYVETRRVSPVKDSVDGLRDLLIIKMNDFKGKYR